MNVVGDNPDGENNEYMSNDDIEEITVEDFAVSVIIILHLLICIFII